VCNYSNHVHYNASLGLKVAAHQKTTPPLSALCLLQIEHKAIVDGRLRLRCATHIRCTCCSLTLRKIWLESMQ